MNIKNILAAVVFLTIAEGAYAQYSQDAFRFSQSDRGSTSRMKAIGNASTAIGGDASSISSNPAGLGFFNKSEFSLSPEYNTSQITGDYLGETATDRRNKFNFNNASVVFNTKKKVPKGYSTDQGLLSVNFGLSWSRTNSFYDNIKYKGYNNNNSVADFFVNQANQYGLNDSPQDLAYQQYLIDDDGNDKYVATPYFGVDQDMIQKTEGGQNEFNLAMGANYGNKLYLGLGLGFTSIRYDSYASFHELGTAALYNEDLNDYEDADYESFYDIDQNTTGSGFNFKLGAIYKPIESLQFGASFVSPTWYSVSDQTSYILDTKYSTVDDWYSGGPSDYDYNYNLRTPMKVSGGLAVFIQQQGFISADIEYVDYSGMKITNSGNDASENRTLSELYKSTVNARVGAEGRLNENVYLRAGYSYLENPEKEIGGATNIVSGGIGYRASSFYVDATYANVSRKQNVYPYEIGSSSPQADLDRKYNNVYLTVGFRF